MRAAILLKKAHNEKINHLHNDRVANITGTPYYY
jgi:hypothetical protein